jgi:membrane-associated phospholipid phosphatase
MKLALAAVLAVIYCSGYLLIERHVWRVPVRFPLSPIDRWIAFSPRWVWVYQSIYLLLPLPFLAATRDEMRRYGIGFGLVMLLAFGCFIAFPVLGPRTASAPATGMYGWLISLDLPLNTFPSLHMAVATYSAAVAVQVTRGRRRRALATLLPPWIILIGYSTLATKQHYAIDLLPGILLGWIAQRAAWRRGPALLHRPLDRRRQAGGRG